MLGKKVCSFHVLLVRLIWRWVWCDLKLMEWFLGWSCFAIWVQRTVVWFWRCKYWAILVLENVSHFLRVGCQVFGCWIFCWSILGLVLLNLLAYEKKYFELVLICDVASSLAFSHSHYCESWSSSFCLVLLVWEFFLVRFLPFLISICLLGL